MIKKELSRKKFVSIRDVFEREDKDFTPWLNDNLDILSHELNIDIIDSNIEKAVGDFSCDIVATDADSNRRVIIENQFGQTDHDHLGKIFTYAAGTDAKTVIWLAETFREEHKKTLEWLNENVDPESRLSFFGIEIRLLQIEESPIAPDFNVIVKPNDWERNIRIIGPKPTSESNKKYMEFFSMLADEYGKVNPSWRKVKALPQNWLGFGAGRSGLAFNWSFRSNNRFSVELYIDTTDKGENERIFEELENHKNEIEIETAELSWEKLEVRRACRIAIYKDIGSSMKTLPESQYPKIIEWAVPTMKQFSNVFSKYVKNI